MFNIGMLIRLLTWLIKCLYKMLFITLKLEEFYNSVEAKITPQKVKKFFSYLLFDNLNPTIGFLWPGPLTIMYQRPNFDTVSIFQSYLTKIYTQKELIIIDPYLFYSPPANGSLEEYARLLKNILLAHMPLIDEIYFITRGGSQEHSKSVIERILLQTKPELKINYKVSREYHDRFWISNNRTCGFFTGTSLNSICIKYSLMALMDEEDVEVIVNSLYQNQLLN